MAPVTTSDNWHFFDELQQKNVLKVSVYLGGRFPVDSFKKPLDPCNWSQGKIFAYYDNLSRFRIGDWFEEGLVNNP